VLYYYYYYYYIVCFIAFLSRGEMLLSCLKGGGVFCGADRYSKQHSAFGHSTKLGHLFYGRASGTGRSPRWVWKMVSFRPWSAPVEEKEQEYTNQDPVVLNVQCSS